MSKINHAGAASLMRMQASGRRRFTASPPSDEQAPLRNPLEVVLWGICIFLLTSPFTYTLINQDPLMPVMVNISNMRQEDNSQWLLYAVRFGVLGLAMLFMLPRWQSVVRRLPRLLPVLPFAGWAALSILWADDFSTTWHSVAGLVSGVFAAFLIAMRLPPVQLGRAVVFAGLIMGLSSLVYALVLPPYGIHQSTDATQYVHAGAWRGVYIHKNFLGQLSAFFAAAIFWAGPATLRPRVVKWAIIAFLVFLLIASTSASAVAILPITIALVWALIAGNATSRMTTLYVALPGAIIGYGAIGFLLSALGRDVTFTGRTVVWQIAMDSFMERPVQGYGYVSITYGDFSYQLMRRAGLFDPHSAYFDIALGTGIIGLVLFLVMIGFTWRAARKVYTLGRIERQPALMLFSLVAGWLVSGVTESSDRPFTAEGGIGLFAVGALMALSGLSRRVRAPRADSEAEPAEVVGV